MFTHQKETRPTSYKVIAGQSKLTCCIVLPAKQVNDFVVSSGASSSL